MPYETIGYMNNNPPSINKTNLNKMDEEIQKTSNVSPGIAVMGNGLQTFYGLGNFQHFGITVNGTFVENQKYRVSNNDAMTFDRDITVYSKEGFRWGYVSNGTWYGWYVPGRKVIIKAGTLFYIQIARVSEITSEIADTGLFLSNVLFASEVGESLEELNPDSPKTFSSSDFTQGVWNNQAIVVSSQRICTKQLYPVRKGDKFEVKFSTSYDVLYGVYDNTGALVVNSQWINGMDAYVEIQVDGLFFFQIKKPDDSNISPSEYAGTGILSFGLMDRFTIFREETINSLNIIQPVGDFNLVQGEINTDGTEGTSTTRVHTDFIRYSKEMKIIRNDSTTRFGLHYYNKRHQHIGNTAWLNLDNYIVPEVENCEYIKMVISYKNSAAITPEMAVNMYVIYMLVKSIVEALNSDDGSLDNPYTYSGEAMPSLKSFQSVRYMGITYSSGVIPQDFDVFGGYLFVTFSGTEQIQVYNLETKALLATMSVETQHGSGIQFSKEYYDETDEFPLLYVGGWEYNIINVIRITKSGDAWTATIVRVLALSQDNGYFLAPSIDSDNNILYCYGYKRWTIEPTNNKMVLLKCDLSDMTLNEENQYVPIILNRIETPYMGVMQGRKYYNGRLYIGFAEQTTPHNARLVTIDAETAETKAIIDMTGITSGENEGVAYVITSEEMYWLYSDFSNVYKLNF